jgi:hypothetical protein
MGQSKGGIELIKPIDLCAYQITDMQARDILFFLSGFCIHSDVFNKGLKHGLRMVEAKKKETRDNEE